MSERKRTEFAGAVEDAGRVATGLLGRLLGPKAVGKKELGPDDAVNPSLDRAITGVGDAVGRVLGAVGHGLEHHPLDPEQAVHEIGSRLREKGPAEVNEGWSALSTGLGTLVGGVGAVADRVIDRVAAEIQPKRDAKDGAPVPDPSAVDIDIVAPPSEVPTVIEPDST
jgi:hypothetical protein